MPIYLIERRFADQLHVDEGVATELNLINADAGVRWLYSFLSADKRKTYSLYEASSPEALREAAQRVGLPIDVVVELSGQINPTGEFIEL